MEADFAINCNRCSKARDRTPLCKCKEKDTPRWAPDSHIWFPHSKGAEMTWSIFGRQPKEVDSVICYPGTVNTQTIAVLFWHGWTVSGRDGISGSYIKYPDWHAQMIGIDFIKPKEGGGGTDMQYWFTLAGGWIPDPDGLIMWCWYESASILRPGNRANPIAIPFKDWRTLAGSRIPDPNSLII